MKKGLKICQLLMFVGVFSLPISVVRAHESVVVIPLDSGPSPLGRIITVAKRNGDFDDPVAAVASIMDAAEDKQYMVYVAPGEYKLNSQLDLKPYVHLIGSGRYLTKLFGGYDAANGGINSALIKIDDPEVFVRNTSVQGMTIENSGNGNNAIVTGIYCNSCNVSIKDVLVTVFGGALHSGIYVDGPAGAHIEDTTIDALAGADNFAITVDSANVTLRNVVANSEDGSASNVGILVQDGSIDTHNVIAKGRGGSNGYGFRFFGIGSDLVDVDAVGQGTADGYGVEIMDTGGTSTNTIRSSEMVGSDDGFRNSFNNTTHISQSRIGNGVSGTGTKTCVAVDDGLGAALSATCF